VPTTVFLAQKASADSTKETGFFLFGGGFFCLPFVISPSKKFKSNENTLSVS
jgi:hypothetical protein